MIETAHIVPMEAHKENLTRLCQICGRLLSRAHRVTYNCLTYAERLEIAFKVQVSPGVQVEDVHPRKFCNECYKVQSVICK